MATNVELKEKLIEKINITNDLELLQDLSHIIDFEKQFREGYKMRQEEIDAVNEGLEQLKNGHLISNYKSDENVDEYLEMNYKI